jgi:hypothetical protein
VRQEFLAEIFQRDALPPHGSSDGSDHAAFLLSFERTAAEDLSGLPVGGRKTCPVPREANTERLVW